MMKKLPTQADLDSQILQLDNPASLFWWLSCLATGLIVVASWLALLGAMVAGLVDWLFWPYVAGPVAIWLALLALPALFKSRRAALTILDTVAVTCEAWLARAGYSIDLNGDGYTGWVSNIEIQQPDEVRPLLVNNRRLLTKDTATPLEIAELDQDETDEPPKLRPRLWELPHVGSNGQKVKIPEETLVSFVEGVFVRGWSRGAWVGKNKPLARDDYDAMIALFEQAGLLRDRKPGSAGRLAVKTPQAARALLKLPPG